MKFNQRFTNIDVGMDEARRRFVNRILYVLFPKYPGISGNQMQLASRALGESIRNFTDFEKIVRGDFYRMLEMLERLIAILPNEDKGGNRLTTSILSQQICQELKASDIDLEIEWSIRVT